MSKHLPHSPFTSPRHKVLPPHHAKSLFDCTLLPTHTLLHHRELPTGDYLQHPANCLPNTLNEHFCHKFKSIYPPFPTHHTLSTSISLISSPVMIPTNGWFQNIPHLRTTEFRFVSDSSINRPHSSIFLQSQFPKFIPKYASIVHFLLLFSQTTSENTIIRLHTQLKFNFLFHH